MSELTIPPDLTHMTSANQNPPPTVPLQSWRSVLINAGISKEDAARWLPAATPQDATRTRIALAWHNAAFDYAEATTWRQFSRWTPEEAAEWRAAQFTAEEATFVSTIIRRDLIKAGRILTRPEPIEREWLAAGLLPSWVCLCVAAGVQKPTTAVSLYKQAETNPDLRGRLHMFGSVLRGADARTLTFETGIEGDDE